MNGCKIVGLIELIGIIAAAGQHRVGDAVAHQFPEPGTQIQLVQFFQKTVLLCLLQLLQIIAQVVIRHVSTDLLHLFHKGGGSVGRWAITVAQTFQHSRFMGGGHVPEARFDGAIASGAGICHIEYIAQPQSWAAVIQQGNAAGSAVDPPAHALIPEFQRGAGGGIWSLCMDQDLISKGVFINSGGSFQKLLPAAAHRGKLCDFLTAKFCNQL